MKIDGNDPFAGIHLNSPSERAAEREQTQRQQVVRIEDRLEFSAQSRDLKHLLEQVRRAPEIRTERVQAISEQIQAGTYNIKAEKVAEAIITGSLFDDLA